MFAPGRWKQAFSEVLGINRRNLDYVYSKNSRRLFPLVDDKIVCKEILAGIGLPVPASLATAAGRAELPACLEAVAAAEAFVIKPACGFGGSGIKAFPACERPGADDADALDEISFHMAAILSGMYAFDSLSDKVLVEEFVEEHPALTAIHGGAGVSDVRVILCDGRPVMAMLRVPCQESRPTANLHRGGIGIGIDASSGRTTFGVCRGRPVSVHSDTAAPLAGIEIPCWKEILRITEPLNQAFGLGYLGADVVVHAAKGPMILEVNARPGLTIQIANRMGLRPVLERKAPRG